MASARQLAPRTRKRPDIVRLNPIQTELTTAATDALLGIVCVAIVWWLAAVRPSWARHVWIAVFTLMAAASFLGAVAHGFDLDARVRGLLWQPLYLSLGVTIALFVVAAVHDWRGEATARALLPWAAAAGVGFYLVTAVLSGAFMVFIAYEAIAMITALAIYGALVAAGTLPGAAWIAAGIAISVLAAIVQATTLSMRVGVVFDHNGLFHLVQIAGAIVLAAGVRVTLMAR